MTEQELQQIREIIREETRVIVQEETRAIVQEELSPIRQGQALLSQNQCALASNQRVMINKLNEMVEVMETGWLSGRRVLPINKESLQVVEGFLHDA